MKTVDIKKFVHLAVENPQDIQRVGRNVKIIYQFIRYGKKALTKVNPTLVYIDAVISVTDAFVQYFTYRKAVEVTKQLQIKLETRKIELANLKAQYEEMLKTEQVEINTHIHLIQEKISSDRDRFELLKKIYDQTGEHLEMIKNQLFNLKRNYMSDDEIRKLEKKYLEAIHARLNITNIIIGG